MNFLNDSNDLKNSSKGASPTLIIVIFRIAKKKLSETINKIDKLRGAQLSIQLNRQNLRDKRINSCWNARCI